MAEFGYPILDKIKELESKIDRIEQHLNLIDKKLDEIKHDLP